MPTTGRQACDFRKCRGRARWSIAYQTRGRDGCTADWTALVCDRHADQLRRLDVFPGMHTTITSEDRLPDR